MGYLLATSACIGCGRVFLFNPHKVPSSSAVTGKREPICQACVDLLNPIRRKAGLSPIVVLPGAYEPASEDEA
jgi:hypothetical protein